MRKSKCGNVQQLTMPQTQAIDDVYRSVQECSSSETEKETEGRGIVEKLARLKYDVQHDRPLE